MRKITSNILLLIGVLFIINAIFGRYLVLPGYLASLDNGSSTNGAIAANVETWQIIRYLLWAYSFKLGILFITIGALVKTQMKKGRLALFIVGGLIYIGVAYVTIPGPFSLFFGIGGGIMTALIIILILRLATERENSNVHTETAVDFKIIGYFFFAMATYNLCPLLGVKCFALEPEKMIEYGLQSQAASFASHVLTELVLGWIFVFLSHFPQLVVASKRNQQSGN
jgi:hypothetical protein